MATADIDIAIKRILTRIEVEYHDEFDMNFKRSGWFAEAWKRRVGPLRPDGRTLIDTNRLHGSFTSYVKGDQVYFAFDAPYGQTHNEGADIRVTRRMKGYFLKKYRDNFTGAGTGRKGWGRGGKEAMTPVEAFWYHMAMKKEGSLIHIPRRQFVGMPPNFETMVRQFVEEELGKFFEYEFNIVET